MIQILLKRLLGALSTLLVLSLLTFLLLRLAPGGPFDSERAWPPEIQAQINAKYGLNLPIHEQYITWFTDALKGDLHESFQYLGQPVTQLIQEALPVSTGLGSLALGLSIVIGISFGALAAWKKNSNFDYSTLFICLSGMCIPSYLLASLLILVFSIQLKWLPPALWDGPDYWILPALTLAARPTALITRLTRASLIEVLQSDFIRTAYGKGLPPLRVLFKHGLKNALIPVLSLLGPLAAQLVTGSFLVEVVFQIPGLGMHFVQSVLNRDYPLVMGLTLTYGLILLCSHFLVDLAYTWIDPRIRVET